MKRLQRVLAFTAVFACLSAELACRPTKVLSASDNVMSESSVLAADTVVDLTPIFPDKAGGTKENPYTISSAYEFTALIRAAKTSSLENVYFVQVCDIVFNEDDAFALNDGILSVAEGKRVLSSYPIASKLSLQRIVRRERLQAARHGFTCAERRIGFIRLYGNRFYQKRLHRKLDLKSVRCLRRHCCKCSHHNRFRLHV